MRNKKSPALLILVLMLMTFGAAGAYIYNSNLFEKQPPKIETPNLIYWNLKNDIQIKLSDNVGIKHVTAQVSDGENSISLANQVFDKAQKEYTLDVKFPRSGFFTKNPTLILTVSVTDNSKWNYFGGNKTTQDIQIILDNKRPLLQILDASYGITKGGAALVAFEATDPNMESIYIKTNYGKIFHPTPFYKDGYYVSLLAWPVDQNDFSAVIVATDKAGNQSQTNVRYYIKARNYKKSNITLKDDFMQGKITELALAESDENEKLSLLDRFKFVNETLRNKNEELIEKLTSKSDTTLMSDFKIDPFYPLKNGAAVASFGDHRTFFKDNQQVSESLHLGLDLASVKNANIEASNDAIVINDEYNGIYGLNLILYHGLGIYSLYGHCNTINFHKNDVVKKGDIVATSGMTGLALGDHLHFGILVQGVEVRPEEWMDKDWIKLNVYDIMDNAKKIIQSKTKS